MGKWFVLNERQRQFVEHVVAGMPLTDAYRAAYPKCRSLLSAKNGVRAAMRKPWVQEYLRQFRAEVMQRSIHHALISRQEVVEFLTAVIRTPAAQVDELSRLCQSFKKTATTHEIRMPGKLEAIDRLCHIMGWYAPEKIEHAPSDPLLDLLESIRARNSPYTPLPPPQDPT